MIISDNQTGTIDMWFDITLGKRWNENVPNRVHGVETSVNNTLGLISNQ